MYRYRLAHSKEIKKNRWNNVCPECGRRGKFSPYIDTVTNEPIAAKECGRCCREKSCAYHMTPKEWFKEHKPPSLIPPRGEGQDRDARTPPPWGRLGGGHR